MVRTKASVIVLLLMLLSVNWAFAQEIGIVQVGPSVPTQGGSAQTAPSSGPVPVGAPGSAGQLQIPGAQAPGLPAATTVPVMPQGAPPGQSSVPAGTTQYMPGEAIPKEGEPMPPGIPFKAPTTGRVHDEELSDIEKYISGKMPQELTFDIKQFGYDLFAPPPSPVAPQENGTAGRASEAWPAQRGQVAPVSAAGPPAGFAPPQNVPVGPDYVVGPGDEIRINVWGGIEGTFNVVVDRDGNITIPKIGTFGVAGLTFNELKEMIYKEFAKSYVDFEMNVSLGNLRSIRVYVVGNARRPGAYFISSLSTFINGLFESGGPSKVGSLRDMQLMRKGETLFHFDFYDFLLKGKKSDDLRLMQEDVIFIPPIGPIAGIAGNVKSPAIYELKGQTRVSDLIKMAGGVAAQAYLQRVQVERVFESRSKVIVDLDLKEMKDKNDILLKDGDLVKIFPITASVMNKVALRGNVLRPGDYEWKKGMRVRDLIKSTKDLLPDALLDTARVDRLVPPDYHQEYRVFNLGGLLLEHDERENIELEPFDVVVVLNRWEMQEKPKVRTAGALHKPGTYDFRQNMKLSDLVRLSGGLKRSATFVNAELTRVTPTPEGPKTDKIQIDLDVALQGNPVADLPLQEDDYLFVRTVPEWDLYKIVYISGEVKYPGSYTIEKSEELSSLLSRVGGFTDKAYLRGAVFIRQSVRAAQQVQIKAMVDRLERELLATGAADVGAAMTPEESVIQAQENRQKMLFIQSLREVEAKGRMVIHLDTPEQLKAAGNDLELEEGDSLHIPTVQQNIQVVGAVYNQTSVQYRDGVDYGYYIDTCGGYTKSADKKSLYILKVDGRATRPKGGLLWDKPTSKWNYGGYAQVEPGDAIIVPDKLERISWMRNIKDITQIFANVASSAGIVFVGLKK